MKAICTVFLMLNFVSAVLSQIEFNPNIIVLESDSTDQIRVIVDIINNSDEPVEAHWMFERGENMPEEWQVHIADDTISYLPNTIKSHPLLPNVIQANDSIEYYIRVETNDIEAASYCILHLYDDADCTNEIASSSPPLTQIQEVNSEDIVVFPNPTLDYFGLQDDGNVQSIEILNKTGQTLMRQQHQTGQLHSIANLSSGAYVLILRNADDQILESLQLFVNKKL